jgi:phytoene dehydrogenase-like protein
MARVVVVGGGLAGCASAARLAKLGHQVTVVEQAPTLGGAVGLLEEDGFVWDTGPATTAVPAVLRDLFRKSGRPLERELELVPVDPMREHRFSDGSVLPLPSGSRAAQLTAVDEALGPPPARRRGGRRGGEPRSLGRQWVDYVHDQAAVWDLLRRDWFERSAGPDRMPTETSRLLHGRSMLQRAVTRRFDDERLRTLAFHHAVQGGHDPRNVPAWFGILDYLEQNFGTWTVPGGFGAFATLLTKRLGERRVEVLTGVTATDVVMSGSAEGARPVAVSTSAGEVAAERVVVAIDPRRLPALAPYVRRTMPAVPPTVTHLGLTDDVPDLPQEVVLHDHFTLTIRTGAQAPPGRAAWTVLGRGRVDEDLVMALARRKIDVRDAIEVRHDLSPRALVEQWGLSSPSGVLWQGRATLRDRLGTRTPLPGVHAAGAHTGGGAWLPFVGLSAALVAEAVGPA